MFAPLFDAGVRAHDECQREPVSADGRQRAEGSQQASRFERGAVELLLSPEDSPDEAEDNIREVAEQIARHMDSRVPNGDAETSRVSLVREVRVATERYWTEGDYRAYVAG